jgi:intein-encoded DNA endonuclease-like protein
MYGVTLSPAVIADWCRGVHTPFGGIRIPTIDFLDPSPELAYVIGVVVGDGWAVKRSGRSGEYRISAKVKDRDFAEEFSRCLGKVLGREPPKPIPMKDEKYRVRVNSNALYKLLQKPINIDKIRLFVEHTRDCTRSFLRGFFDAEGSVTLDGDIYCYNTDHRLLEYTRRLLGLLGIKTTDPKIRTKKGTLIKDWKTGKTYIKKKDVYYLYVRADTKLNFYKHVGFTIQRKRQRLEECLKRRGLLNVPLNQSSS